MFVTLLNKVGGIHSGSATIDVTLMDRDGVKVTSTTQTVSVCSSQLCSNKASGKLSLSKPHLWWPWTMSETPGYMYELQVKFCYQAIILC